MFNYPYALVNTHAHTHTHTHEQLQIKSMIEVLSFKKSNNILYVYVIGVMSEFYSELLAQFNEPILAKAVTVKEGRDASERGHLQTKWLERDLVLSVRGLANLVIAHSVSIILLYISAFFSIHLCLSFHSIFLNPHSFYRC